MTKIEIAKSKDFEKLNLTEDEARVVKSIQEFVINNGVWLTDDQVDDLQRLRPLVKRYIHNYVLRMGMH